MQPVSDLSRRSSTEQRSIAELSSGIADGVRIINDAGTCTVDNLTDRSSVAYDNADVLTKRLTNRSIFVDRTVSDSARTTYDSITVRSTKDLAPDSATACSSASPVLTSHTKNAGVSLTKFELPVNVPTVFVRRQSSDELCNSRHYGVVHSERPIVYSCVHDINHCSAQNVQVVQESAAAQAQYGLGNSVAMGVMCSRVNPLLVECDDDGGVDSGTGSNSRKVDSNIAKQQACAAKPKKQQEIKNSCAFASRGACEITPEQSERTESRYSRNGTLVSGSSNKVEWLHVVELFSFFANLIQFHQLQMQYSVCPVSSAEARFWHSAADRESENGYHNEAENECAGTMLTVTRQANVQYTLTRLRNRITFSAHEIRQLYLNRVFVRWSNAHLRHLTKAVVQSWLADSDSEFCRRASADLIDAIVREDRGTIAYSPVFRSWRWVGHASHTTRVLVMFVFGSAMLVAWSSVLYATSQARNSALHVASYVILLLVAVCQVCMFACIVHHNSFTDVAARYFREEALLNAKDSVNEDELVPCELHGRPERSSYTSLSDVVDEMVEDGVGATVPHAQRCPVSPDLPLSSARHHAAGTQSDAAAVHVAYEPMPTSPSSLLAWSDPRGGHGCASGNTVGKENNCTSGGDNSHLHTRVAISKVENSSFHKHNSRGQCDSGSFSARPSQALVDSNGCSLHLDEQERHLSGIQFVPQFTTIAKYTPSVYDDGDKNDGHFMDKNGGQFLRRNDHVNNEGEEERRHITADGVEESSSSSTTCLTTRQIFAGIRGRIQVTAFVFCHNEDTTQMLVLNLARFHVDVQHANTLEALEQSFAQSEQPLKVMLLHAPDLPESSLQHRTAMRWVRHSRPVFFFGADIGAYAVHLPTLLCKELPLREEDINAMLLAGLGVDDPNNSFVSISPVPFKIPVYTLGRRLGGGAYGNVFEVELEKSGAKCAVKRMYLREEYNASEVAASAAAAGCSERAMAQARDSSSNTSSNKRNSANVDVKISNRAAMVSSDTSKQAVVSAANGVTTDLQANDVTGVTSNRVVLNRTNKTDETDGTHASATTTAVLSSSAIGDVACGNMASDTIVGGQLCDIVQEVEIMSSLSHRNIVRYMFCDRDDNCISIFMELCTGGSLSTMLASRAIVSAEQAGSILRDIISAVEYLHRKRIVHRDLKPDNVLFNNGVAKVTDFGTAVHKKGDLRLMKGTFAYMAPEVLVGEAYGKACDVWSIGCIAAEVLAVDLPQRSLGLPELCDYYRHIPMTEALAIDCSVAPVRSFLVSCLQRNPSVRQSASALLQHEILQPGSCALVEWMNVVKERSAQRSESLINEPGGGGMLGRNISYDLISNGNPSLDSSQIF